MESKNDDAAEVARAAAHMVVTARRSEPRLLEK